MLAATFTVNPASADMFTLFGMNEPVATRQAMLAPAPATGALTPAVAALDPGWTATVVAYAPERMTTGSIAGADLHAPLPGPRITGTGHALQGVASYYWQDQMTATGERFDKRAMTAAHKTLPFGTKVRVTRVDTGKAVIVRINDRGPYKPGRIIDLSESAAEGLGMTGIGTTPVRLDVLGQ